MPISEDTDGFIYFIDAERLAMSEEGIHFWVKSLYRYNAGFPKAEKEEIDGQRIDHTLASFTADCETGILIGPYSWTAYGAGDRLLRTVTNRNPEGIASPPDTVADSWMEAVCSVVEDADDVYHLEASELHFI